MNNFFIKPQMQTAADDITFVITDECNLRCKYCYEKDKQSKYMTIETAKKAADYFIDIWQNRYDEVVFDFIGGEPFVMPDLLEELLTYIEERMRKQTKWKRYVFSFSTNGVCFDDEKVCNLIEKHHEHMSVGISLDGCKTIHDYNRSNSFDALMEGFPYWRKQFWWCSTKSTLNHESIPYVFESIKFLHSLCMKHMYMNTVSEDVWQDGDDKLFYDQLIKSADYILDNKLYKEKYISLFDLGTMMDIEHQSNWCGCGSCMIAVDYKGNLFPCMRFKTLSKMEPLSIGNIFIDNGKIDYKKLLPFYFCHNTIHTPDCENCDAKAMCPNCTAFCYDETGSIFDRVSYMCDMHRARVKANRYYWNKLAKLENTTIEELKKYYFDGM